MINKNPNRNNKMKNVKKISYRKIDKKVRLDHPKYLWCVFGIGKYDTTHNSQIEEKTILYIGISLSKNREPNAKEYLEMIHTHPHFLFFFDHD